MLCFHGLRSANAELRLLDHGPFSSVYLSFLHPGMRRNGTSGSTQSGAKSQNSRLFFGFRIASSSFECKQLYRWNFALCTYYLVSCVSCNSMVSQIMMSSFIQPKFKSARAIGGWLPARATGTPATGPGAVEPASGRPLRRPPCAVVLPLSMRLASWWLASGVLCGSGSGSSNSALRRCPVPRPGRASRG